MFFSNLQLVFHFSSDCFHVVLLFQWVVEVCTSLLIVLVLIISFWVCIHIQCTCTCVHVYNTCLYFYHDGAFPVGHVHACVPFCFMHVIVWGERLLMHTVESCMYMYMYMHVHVWGRDTVISGMLTFWFHYRASKLQIYITKKKHMYVYATLM